MNRVLIIVPSPIIETINSEIRTQGIDSGEADSITVPLWPVDADQTTTQPSHYWCSWSMTNEQLQKLNQINSQYDFGVFLYSLDESPSFPQAKLSELGLTTKTGGPL